jgi:hypothetical protein
MRHPVRLAPLVVLLALGLTTAPAPADAAAKAIKKARCPAGKVPVITGRGKRARPALDRKGRLRCAAPKKVALKAIPVPAATPGAELGAVADALDQALAVAPGALAPIERKLGAKRAKKLLAVALDSWRTRAARAATAARAARAARGARAHAAETKSDTYSPVAGADMTFTGEFGTVDDGVTGGYRGSAVVEGNFSRGGLEKLAEKAGAGALPPGVKDGRAKLELSFADLPQVCPDARGKVKGTLKASGKLTLTVGSASVTLAAELDVSYALQVGDDARWKTIDDVDVKTAFSIGGSGRSTETWRGRRTGTGFGHDGILGAKDAGAAITADMGHISDTGGGNFGPHGGINRESGTGGLWDLRSIDNVKGLIANNYANAILMLAALEYVRKVAADRVQKHWLDDEQCLKLDAAAAASRLRAGQTTTVTAKNARAADGGPVPAGLTASGVASLTPGSAALAAGGSQDFTLTALSVKPAKSSWKVVALSRAGRKTVTGDLGEGKGPYTVTVDDHEIGRFATHDATGHLTGTLAPAAVEGSSPQQWQAAGPVTWSALTASPKLDCSYVDPVAGGNWSVTITELEGDRIRVALDFTAETKVLWTVVCEGGSVAGQAGTTPLGMAPRTFELPADGGTQALAGSLTLGADGFFTDGTLTVAPVAP